MVTTEALLSTTAVAGVMVGVGLVIGGLLGVALYRGGRE
jgi:hypothetical protein